MAKIERRGFLFTIAAAALCASPARAQTLDADSLQKLIAFFRDSATMTGAVAVSVGRLKPTSFKRAERPGIAQELTRFSEELDQLVLRHGVLTGTIADYVQSVRTGGFKAETHEAQWRGLNGMIRDVAGRVEVVYKMQSEAKWAKVALTPAQDASLRETLEGKQSILFQLQYLAAPRTPEEINALEILDQRYVDLMKRQYELRVALKAAAKRFGATPA